MRRQASDAERLLLEEHLTTCAECLAERGRGALLERLRDGPRPRVSVATRQRILALTDLDAAVDATPATVHGAEAWGTRVPRRRTALVATLAAAALLALVLGGRLLIRRGASGTGAPALAASGSPSPSASASPATPASPTSPTSPTAPTSPASPTTNGAGAPTEPSPSGDGRLIAAEHAGEVRLDGALVRYAAATVLRLHPEDRRVDLLDGEVDVEVTPGQARRFRVVTARFIVEVVGTRFFVHPDGVQTVHGVVRVLDASARGERELAVVRAGESWRVTPESGARAATAGSGGHPSDANRRATVAAPIAVQAADRMKREGAAAPSLAGSPVVSPAVTSPPTVRTVEPARSPVASTEPPDDVPRSAPLPAARPTAVPPPAQGPPPPPEPSRLTPPTVAALLHEARAALAEGDAARARSRIAAALGARPGPRERATADLLFANALLVEGRPDRAADAYRDVAARHPDQPEAETALFALAQLLSERGRPGPARATLEEYARRYPSGHFAAEVREKLARLPRAP